MENQKSTEHQKQPICPYCQNKVLWKVGKNSVGEPRYKCKKCQRSFGGRPREPYPEHLICPECQGKNYIRSGGKNPQGYQRFCCKSCNTFFSESPESKKYRETKKEPIPEGLMCPRCGSRNFTKYSAKSKQGDQGYKCKDCCRNFHDTTRSKTYEEFDPNIKCPHCDSVGYSRASKTQTGRQRYRCRKCKHTFSHHVFLAFTSTDDPGAEYLKDRWDIRNLGLAKPMNRVKNSYKITFSSISQVWLKSASKNFIRFSLSHNSQSESNSRLASLRAFSRFLKEHYPTLESENINRQVIVDFITWIDQRNLAPSTKMKYLIHLKVFLETCNRFEWIDVPEGTLIYKEDYPKIPKSLPRYIPEDILRQLNENIGFLPEPTMRMVLVLQECGMRVSELCLLKYDCLIQDSMGDWFLRYIQYKMNKEISIPISKEIVRVIQEQQQFIRDRLGIGYEYLFSSRVPNNAGYFIPIPRPMTTSAFASTLKRLAKDRNIVNSFGEIWNFQAHQFRHTVGTRMVNSGVPINIIMKYLGHESPGMTMAYARIHDQTLKTEFAKFQGKVVNVAGQVVESENLELDTSELQWFKRSVQAQALPNGACALPTMMQECPHANACLTCTHFRTTTEFLDQHREQLYQTEKLIEKAEANGWTRQAEMNERVANNLQNIIRMLEAENDI